MLKYDKELRYKQGVKIMSVEKIFVQTAAETLDDLAERTGAQRERAARYWAARLAAMRETVETHRAEAPVDRDPDQSSRAAQLLLRLQENVDTVNAGGQSRGYADLLEQPARPQHPLLIAMQQRIAERQADEM